MLAAAFSISASAQINFESPYTLGALSSGGGSSTSVNPFTGQQGWSVGSGNVGGTIVATTSSGSYVGGQALEGGGTGASGNAYLGANNTFSWGGSSGIATISYDLLWGGGDKMGIGGWSDANSDGNYEQNEVSAYGGLSATGQFLVRAGNSGSLNGFGENDVNAGGLVANTTDWYQMTLTYNDAAKSITMGVIDLTTGATLDLGGGSTALWTDVLSGAPGSSDYYGSGVAGFNGVFARATGGDLIDNIATVSAPEPATWALAGLGGVLILIWRRRFCGSSLISLIK
jgi:hypothetical protein